MLGHSSGNHDWLLANAIACVYCGFHLRNARNASDCVWMETGLYTHTHTHGVCIEDVRPTATDQYAECVSTVLYQLVTPARYARRPSSPTIMHTAHAYSS